MENKKLYYLSYDKDDEEAFTGTPALIKEGYDNLIYPSKHTYEINTKEKTTRISLNVLQNCDGVIFVGRWRDSEKCMSEYHIAQYLGLEIKELGDDKHVYDVGEEYDGLFLKVCYAVMNAMMYKKEGVFIPIGDTENDFAEMCEREFMKCGLNVFINPLSIICREGWSNGILIYWVDVAVKSKWDDDELLELDYVVNEDWENKQWI